MFLLCGCETTSTPFLWSSAQSIKVGMSKDQVISAMGKPREDVHRPDGTEAMVWRWNDGYRENMVSFILRSNRVVQVPTKMARSQAELRDQIHPELISAPAPAPAPIVSPPSEPAFYTNTSGQVRLNIPLVRNRDAFFDSHPGLSQKKRDAIDNHEVWIGMSREEAQASWGQFRSRQVTASTEVWVYSASASLIFQNGVLASFSE